MADVIQSEYSRPVGVKYVLTAENPKITLVVLFEIGDIRGALVGIGVLVREFVYGIERRQYKVAEKFCR